MELFIYIDHVASSLFLVALSLLLFCVLFCFESFITQLSLASVQDITTYFYKISLFYFFCPFSLCPRLPESLPQGSILYL